MGATIRLQTCFALPESRSELTFLPEGVKTVRDLLLHMGHQIDYNFIDPLSSSIEEDLDIILNNKEIWFYPTALDTFLNDGDSLKIYLRPLGGG